MPNRLSVIAFLLALVACEDAAAPLAYDAGGRGVDPDLLTPDVAVLLDAFGRFPQQQPEFGYINARSRAQAEAVAKEYIAEHGEEQLWYWEIARGEAIDLASLTRCGRIEYAASAYEVTVMTPDQPSRQAASGRYIVAFCEPGGRPVVEMRVSIEPPLPAAALSAFSSDVWGIGIPVEREELSIPSAEDAARIAAGRTGRRVAAVPELIRDRFAAGWEHWHVKLESPVIVSGSLTAERDTLDFVLVGRYYSDSDGSVTTRAQRPIEISAAGVKDTIPYASPNALDVFHLRIGMPRWSEPFWRYIP